MQKIWGKKTLLKLSDHSKVVGYKVNVQSTNFLYTNNEEVEFRIKNLILFTLPPPKN